MFFNVFFILLPLTDVGLRTRILQAKRQVRATLGQRTRCPAHARQVAGPFNGRSHASEVFDVRWVHPRRVSSDDNVS